MKNTIKKHYEFIKQNNDITINNDLFIIKIRKNNLKEYRYGLVITKKKIKLAVDRNKCKRIIRNWLLNNNEKPFIEGYDYIFILKKNIINVDFHNEKKILNKSLFDINKTLKSIEN